MRSEITEADSKHIGDIGDLRNRIKEIREVNSDLQKKIEGVSVKKSNDQSDKIVKRAVFFLSQDAANGLTVYLMPSGKLVYKTTDNKFIYLQGESAFFSKAK
jgi:hypothetical protein